MCIRDRPTPWPTLPRSARTTGRISAAALLCPGRRMRGSSCLGVRCPGRGPPTTKTPHAPNMACEPVVAGLH
eukprot:12883997-Alexandrium_andersonii.AAC.1